MKLGFKLAVLACCLLTTAAQALAAAETSKPVKTVRLLTVGNSFSRNATRYLDRLAAADGNVLVHHQAYIGGSTMAQHLEKAEQYDKDPQDKRGLYASGQSLKQELLAEPWDFITIQQASIRSHDLATYQPYARRLYEYIHKHAPQAEILLHETWAYRRDDPRFSVASPAPGEPATQEAMYRGLAAAYRTIAAELKVRLIPVGDAFHRADTDPRWGYRPDSKFDFKTAQPPALPDQTHSLHVGWQWQKQRDGTMALRMDGHHANTAGEYLGGCVFYEVLFGRSAVGNSFVPQGLDPAYAQFLQKTAHQAVAESAAADSDLHSRALAGLKRTVAYYVDHVATEGGYLYHYSADLTRREGELKASATTIWVQPPGTPAVGLALLRAWEATGDAFYLDAAHKAGQALVRGQLLSGGWDYKIEFAPADRARMAYRVEPHNPKGANVTTLDDNTTQAALRLLMRLERALADHGQPDSTIREAIGYALVSLLRAQYPNGAWPQRYSQPPDAKQFPVLPASYPQSWDRTWPKPKYTGYYTFNDNAMNDVIDVLLEAGRLYDEPKYRAAAEHGGDFILLAQMPDPQPAWAQQYDAQMHPAWARKFEPPAVTGGESQSVMVALMSLYRETGKRKYLDPIPRALDYLQASRLPDGYLARFYELRTNRPLYFTRDYQLTYSNADAPTHYSFKIESKLDRIRRDYERLRDTPLKKLAAPTTPKVRPPGAELIASVKSLLAAMDDRGRWLEQGKLKAASGPDGGEPIVEPIIRNETFIKNVQVLSNYLAAEKALGAGQ